jgi:hypothetical protein
MTPTAFAPGMGVAAGAALPVGVVATWRPPVMKLVLLTWPLTATATVARPMDVVIALPAELVTVDVTVAV